MHKKSPPPPPKHGRKPKANGLDFLNGLYGKRQKPRNQNFGQHFKHP